MVLVLSGFTAFSQTTYHNLGFESGSLINWSGATGSCCPVLANTPGLIPGRQDVITGNATDPHSSGLVTVVAPGSLWSAKLGNDNGSAESERLAISFRVPSDSLLLVLRFALIFENAQHPPSKQPRFSYQVTTNSGNINGCTEETIISGDPAYPYNVSGMIEVLPWQYRLIDLSGHLNDSIQIKIETGDCEPGGHFGYAYVDCDLIPNRLNAILCNPDGSMTVYAPEGIDGTWSGGQVGDTLVIANPTSGTAIQFLPDQGCGIVIQKDTYAEIPPPGIIMQPFCNQVTAFAIQLDTAMCSLFHWDFGDGNISGVPSPVHQYAQAGNFMITIEATLNNNCRTLSSLELEVPVSPEASFEVASLCPGKPLLITNTSLITPYSTSPYNWFLNGTWQSSAESPELIPGEPGGSLVTLVVTDQFNCADSVSKWVMMTDADSCHDQFTEPWVPVAFTPNGDGLNDIFQPVFNIQPGFLNITITDRYGKLVYEGRGWDGGDCPQGIYVCTIRYDAGNSVHQSISTVSLIR